MYQHWCTLSKRSVCVARLKVHGEDGDACHQHDAGANVGDGVDHPILSRRRTVAELATGSLLQPTTETYKTAQVERADRTRNIPVNLQEERVSSLCDLRVPLSKILEGNILTSTHKKLRMYHNQLATAVGVCKLYVPVRTAAVYLCKSFLVDPQGFSPCSDQITASFTPPKQPHETHL